MRLTRAGEYAVRTILCLAARGPQALVPRQAVAREMDIPGPFLAKIARQLARTGFLEIVQGAKGGFRLRVSPEHVTLLEVVEAVEGEIYLNDCIMDPASCPRSPRCAVHRVWERARDRLRQCLGEATFQSLLEEGVCTGALPEGIEGDETGRTRADEVSTRSGG